MGHEEGTLMDILFTLAMFIVVIGVLITVHEYGHFWLARQVGIKIHKFSVGFGPALFSRQGRDGVEYVIAALPLGGYVKMAGEVPGEASGLPPGEEHRAYNRRPVLQRMAVASAGPLMNFLFAVAVLVAVYLLGIQGIVPRIGYVAPESPAAAASLQREDKLEAVGGEEVRSWNEVRLALMRAAMDREPVVLRVARGGQTVHRTLDLSQMESHELQSELLHRIGLAPYWPVVAAEIKADSPAEQAGLQPGDRIVGIQGEPLASWSRFLEIVREHPQQALSLTVKRGDGPHQLTVTPRAISGKGGESVGRIGLRPEPLPEALQVTIRYGPIGALGQGLAKTGEMLWLTVESLVRMITGSISSETLGGPIAIAQFAGQSAEAGLVPFLWFLAMISLSLGILNLLPIPVLDGGHLLFQAIEGIRGRPLDEETLMRWQQVGIAVIFGIMLFAFYNDLQRLFR